MSIRSWVRASLLMLSIGLLVGINAQSSTTGNITGTVRDPQGAAVPKAEVTITDEKKEFPAGQKVNPFAPKSRMRLRWEWQ